MRRERGAVLILVLGLLAVIFLAAAAALLPAWSASRAAEDGREQFLAMLAARSAVECCLAVLEDFRSAHSTAERGMAFDLPSLDKEEIRSRVAALEDAKPPLGRLAFLRSQRRPDLFDLTTSAAAPVRYRGAVSSPHVHALTYFRTLSVRVPELPAPESVPEHGAVRVEGEGEWRTESLGWGVTGLFEGKPMPPAASSFGRARAVLRFGLAVERDADGRGFLVWVFFPRPAEVEERGFLGGSEELFSLPWPWGE